MCCANKQTKELFTKNNTLHCSIIIYRNIDSGWNFGIINSTLPDEKSQISDVFEMCTFGQTIWHVNEWEHLKTINFKHAEHFCPSSEHKCIVENENLAETMPVYSQGRMFKMSH